MSKERKKFCHFWNNGKCRYSDSQCWYLHRESPECKFGRKCEMRRCMFYHPHRESWDLKGKQYAGESWFPRQGSKNERLVKEYLSNFGGNYLNISERLR